jgi:hypothetical protein
LSVARPKSSFQTLQGGECRAGGLAPSRPHGKSLSDFVWPVPTCTIQSVVGRCWIKWPKSFAVTDSCQSRTAAASFLLRAPNCSQAVLCSGASHAALEQPSICHFAARLPGEYERISISLTNPSAVNYCCRKRRDCGANYHVQFDKRPAGPCRDRPVFPPLGPADLSSIANTQA